MADNVDCIFGKEIYKITKRKKKILKLYTTEATK